MSLSSQPKTSLPIFNRSQFVKEDVEELPENIVLHYPSGLNIPAGYSQVNLSNLIYIKKIATSTSVNPVISNSGASVNVNPFSTFDALTSNPMTAVANDGTGITWSVITSTVDTLSFGSSYTITLRATDSVNNFTDGTFTAVILYPTYSSVSWLGSWATNDIVINQNDTFNFRFANGTLGISIIDSNGADRALALVNAGLITFIPNFSYIANNVSITFKIQNGPNLYYNFTKQFDVMNLGYAVSLPADKEYLISSYDQFGENGLGLYVVNTYMPSASIEYTDVQGLTTAYPYIGNNGYNFNTSFYETNSPTFGVKPYSTAENTIWTNAIDTGTFFTAISRNTISKDKQYVMRLQMVDTSVSTDFLDVMLVFTDVWNWTFTSWVASATYDVASNTFTDSLNGAVSGYNNYLTSASPITLTYGGNTVSPTLTWSPSTPSANSFNGIYSLSYSASYSASYGVQNDAHSNTFTLTITNNPRVWSYSYPTGWSSSHTYSASSNSFDIADYTTIIPIATYGEHTGNLLSSTWSPSVPDGTLNGSFTLSYSFQATHNGNVITDTTATSLVLVVVNGNVADYSDGGVATSYYNDNGTWTASANTLSLSMATNALHYKYKISMSDDGTRLCVLNRTGASRVNIYDLINGTWTLNSNSPVSLTTTTSDLNCAMSGNGQAFVIGANGTNPEAYIENANGSWSLTYIATSLTQFLTCGLNYDGTKAVIASNDGSLKVWNFTISATSIETITSSPRQLFAGFGGDNCVICADDLNPFNEVNIFQKNGSTWSANTNINTITGTNIGGVHLARDSLSCAINDGTDIDVYTRSSTANIFSLLTTISSNVSASSDRYDIYYSLQIANNHLAVAYRGKVFNLNTANNTYVLDPNTSSNSGLITYLSTDASRLFNATMVSSAGGTGTQIDHLDGGTIISFVNNDLTIENAISSTDTDKIQFTIPSGYSMTGLTLAIFTGSSTVNYSLNSTTNSSFSSSDVNTNILPSTNFASGTTHTLVFTLAGSNQPAVSYKLTGVLV